MVTIAFITSYLLPSIMYKLLRTVGPLQLGLAADFELQPARLGQRPTLLTRLRRDCSGPC